MSDEIYLAPMTEAQFAIYAAYTCENYARTSPNYRDVPLESALSEVREAFTNRLPDGPRTADYFLLTIFLREGGGDRQIGFFDIGRTKRDLTKAYSWNVVLDAGFRGKGYGKRALNQAEELLRKQGITRVGLNVFSDNVAARALYEQSGFKVTQMNMEKSI